MDLKVSHQSRLRRPGMRLPPRPHPPLSVPSLPTHPSLHTFDSPCSTRRRWSRGGIGGGRRSGYGFSAVIGRTQTPSCRRYAALDSPTITASACGGCPPFSARRRRRSRRFPADSKKKFRRILKTDSGELLSERDKPLRMSKDRALQENPRTPFVPFPSNRRGSFACLSKSLIRLYVRGADSARASF